jgi:hypothetical protein
MNLVELDFVSEITSAYAVVPANLDSMRYPTISCDPDSEGLDHDIVAVVVELRTVLTLIGALGHRSELEFETSAIAE